MPPKKKKDYEPCWTRYGKQGQKYVVCAGSKGQKKPEPKKPEPKPKPKPKKVEPKPKPKKEKKKKEEPKFKRERKGTYDLYYVINVGKKFGMPFYLFYPDSHYGRFGIDTDAFYYKEGKQYGRAVLKQIGELNYDIDGMVAEAMAIKDFEQKGIKIKKGTKLMLMDETTFENHPDPEDDYWEAVRKAIRRKRKPADGKKKEKGKEQFEDMVRKLEPKPEPPKPKPKKTEPKKVPTKSEQEKVPSGEKVGKLMEVVLKQDPIRWACFGGSAIYIYLKILAKHKNDCVFGFGSADATLEAGAFPTVASKFFSTVGGGTRDSMFGMNVRMANKPEVQKRILEQYRKCKRNGKILCVPYFKTSHANMIIFNFHTDTIEYYEPHGTGTKPFENSIKKITQYFNKNGEKMKYTLSAEACPNVSKDTRGRLMGLQALEHTRVQENDPEQKAETGGFCCMWSFLHMDYRLAHPRQPPNAMANELVQLAKKDPNNFYRQYIRGYTDTLLKEMYDAVGEEKVKSVMGRKISKANIRAAYKAFDPLIEKLWKAAGGKFKK